MTILTLCEDAATLLRKWHEARGTNTLPSSRFIDPLELRDWVGDISVIHLHEGPRRFYVALHGANVARHLGPDFHKQYLEDVAPQTAYANTFAPYELSIQTRQPSYSIQSASLDSRLFKTLARMILPCSHEDPEQVGRFLIWVAPINIQSPASSLAFVPYRDEGKAEGSIETSACPAQLYLLADEYAA